MNHDNISYVKSFIRIIASLVIIWAGISYSSSYLVWAGGLLALAELLGVLEEIV